MDFMKRFSFLFLLMTTLASCDPLYAATTKIQAKDVKVNTSAFTNNLTSADDTVQKSLNTLDAKNLVGPQGPAGPAGAAGAQGPAGAAGPNQVTSATTTDMTGVLIGNGANITSHADGYTMSSYITNQTSSAVDCALPGVCTVTTSANNERAVPSAMAGTLKKLTAKLTGAPGGTESYTIRIYLNNVATSLLCQFIGAATTCTDDVNTVTVSRGDVVGAKFTKSSAPANYTDMGFSVIFVPN